ncbi:aquaporin AQPAe.a-like isoform X2 [Chelonus insularis]|nr:aquaporin AQPAe.a-like isoform X2 [Chelonus insularis]
MMYGHGEIWDTLLCGAAEFAGTAMLVLLGCGGCIGSLGIVPSYLQANLTFGLAVMIVIQCFGHISHAHVNPAITVGSIVLGKKSIAEGLVYLVAQMLGSVMGYGLLKLITPTGMMFHDSPEAAHNFCITALNPMISTAQGLMAEILATMVLMAIACAVWDKRNEINTDSTALRFGLAVSCLAMVFGKYTGCSMNPARSFGPAIWNNSWSEHWVYWFGPITGSALAAALYRVAFGIKEDNNELQVPEAVGLNYIDADKPERV